MIYRLLALAALGIAAIAVTGPARATSFNCGNATIPAESAICNSGQLSQLDEQMASSYFSLINSAPGWAVRQIKAQQSAWLARRDACGYDPGCLKGAYYARLGVLDGWHGRLGM